jgi:hypothetical protein
MANPESRDINRYENCHTGRPLDVVERKSLTKLETKHNPKERMTKKFLPIVEMKNIQMSY